MGATGAACTDVVTIKAKAAKAINLIMRFSLQEVFWQCMVVASGPIMIDPYQNKTARNVTPLRASKRGYKSKSEASN